MVDLIQDVSRLEGGMASYRPDSVAAWLFLGAGFLTSSRVFWSFWERLPELLQQKAVMHFGRGLGRIVRESVAPFPGWTWCHDSFGSFDGSGNLRGAVELPSFAFSGRLWPDLSQEGIAIGVTYDLREHGEAVRRQG